MAPGSTLSFELGGKDDAAMAAQIVQRLDAERIARQNQLTRAFVEQGKREHTAEPAQRRRAPAAPGLHDDLGVRLSSEGDTASNQLGLQCPVVVQLTVVDDRQPILVQRLVCSSAEVDDRQAPESELHADGVALV